MLSEHHWQENEKKGKSCLVSSYKWIKMLEFTYFCFSVLWWMFEKTLHALPGKNKQRMKLQKLKATIIPYETHAPSVLKSVPQKWSFSALAAFTHMQLKLYYYVLISKMELPNWHTAHPPQQSLWFSEGLVYGSSGNLLITEPKNQFRTVYYFKIHEY